MEGFVDIPQYDSYKDSGVDWLGSIPESWGVKPGLVAFSENKRNNKGMKESRVLSLSYGKIVIKPEEKLIGLVPESFETYQLVEPSDIIIRCTDLQNDKVSLRTGLAKDKGIITSAYLNLKVKKGFNSRFLHYFLHSLDTTKVIYKFGSGLRQNLSFLDFKRLPIFDIPETTQSAIAQFLDKKTAQIDEAIAIKEKQITLLKERKQIIIQKAVTQGLNPDVPMKDSGVDWIGDIPEHWEVKKLKHGVKIQGGFAFQSSDFKGDGIQLLKIANLYQNRLALERQPTFISVKLLKKYSDWVVKKGDILMSLTGTLGKRDYGFAILLDNDEHYFLNQRVARLSASDLFETRYLTNLLQSESYLNQIYQLPAGTKQANLSNDNVVNAYVTVPTFREQTEIADFVEVSSRENAKLIALQIEQIEKLKEYKTTLINSAVTGKIKVA